jgi:hypothetical protein
MMFAGPFPVQSKPLLNASIGFTRRLPTGLAAASSSGLAVEVLVRPDLRVVVLLVNSVRVGLTGRFSYGRVLWDQAPCAEFPDASMRILAADVCDVLGLFERRLIDPRSWTSIPEALAQL